MAYAVFGILSIDMFSDEMTRIYEGPDSSSDWHVEYGEREESLDTNNGGSGWKRVDASTASNEILKTKFREL